MAAEPFIGKPEVARRLGRTARCVEQMMARGILPFYRWDSQAAFRWSEVQLALANSFRRGTDGNLPVGSPSGGARAAKISTPHPNPLPDRGGEGVRAARATNHKNNNQQA
jgi:hypothetical protein